MEITQIPGIVGAILFTLQWLKKIPMLSTDKAKEFFPLIAAVLGAIFAVIYQIVFSSLPFDIASIAYYLAQGFIIGLTACGTFDFVKYSFIKKG